MKGDKYAIPPKDKAVEGILWYIQSEHVKPGDRLPAEREMCEDIGVSRTALRAAIARLVSCGTLESRQGSGTYVCPLKPLNVFQTAYNYSQSVLHSGQTPGAILIYGRVEKASLDIAEKMGIGEGDAVYSLRRVRTVNGAPAVVETAGVNYALCPGIEAYDFSCESLYNILETKYGVEFAHGREHVSIARATKEEAELLAVDEGAPVYFETTLEFDSDMTPIEYCRSIALPTKYRFADNGEERGTATKVGETWLNL